MRFWCALSLLGMTGCDVVAGLNDMIHDLPDGPPPNQSPACGVVWAQGITSSSYASVGSVAMDEAGVYVNGTFASDVVLDDQPTTKDVDDEDAFVARLDPASGSSVWLRAYGDGERQGVYDLALGPSNTLVMGGWTQGEVAGCNTVDHAFVASIARDDPTNTTCFAFSATDPDPLNMYTPESWVTKVATTPDGNLWVMGIFAEALDYDSGVLSDFGTFLTKHDATTLAPRGAWSHTGDPTVEEHGAHALAADDTHVSVAITTNFSSGQMFGAVLDSDPGGDDNNVLVAQLDAGGAVSSARAIGGNGDQEVGGAALDASGNPIIVGRFDQEIDFGDGIQSIDTILSTGAAFATRFDAGEPVVLDAPSSSDAIYDVVVDAAGNSYVTGAIGPDHGAPLARGCPTQAVDAQAFVAKIGDNGQLIWLRRFAGASYGVALALSPDGTRLAMVGIYSGDLDLGAFTLTSDPEIENSFVVVMTTS